MSPPKIGHAKDSGGLDSFVLDRELVDAFVVRRSPILFVTFDNLATVGEHETPQPWLHNWMENLGFSVLGLIASRKDWYRNADTPWLLNELKQADFFEGFERVVFAGTSMGGYAALTYSRLVPGSDVLLFSPQTTLNRTIAPFERRFRYAQRKWDWDSLDYLDATESVQDARAVWLFYDPFVNEDCAHAKRIIGHHVRHIKCGHFGHRVMRQLKACGVLGPIFKGIGVGQFDENNFRTAMRERRNLKVWRKAFLHNLVGRGHTRLALRLADRFLNDDPTARYARRTIKQLQEAKKKERRFEEIVVKDEGFEPPFRGAIFKARQAIVVPERDHDIRLASGVLFANREYCEMSRAWIRAGKSTPPPTLMDHEQLEKLSGRHLFAGHMRGHFGHFLVESTARLWAMGELENEIDSVIYLPYRGAVGQTKRVISRMKNFFQLLEISIPIQTFGTSIEVEELYVPELGFGWRERYAGSPAYRNFMRERLGRNIAPEGGEKLYISRARLPSQRGGVLGETIIEENLERQGYEIFHPEKHPLEVQISRYKAARQIVALDGSALHLAAFFLKEGSKVGIILRRSKSNFSDYVLQYQSFCGVTPDIVNAVSKDWMSGGAKRVDFRSVGELDFTELFNRLETLGYVESGHTLRLPSEEEMENLLGAFSERRREEFAAINRSH